MADGALRRALDARDRQQRRLAAQMEKDAVLRSLDTGTGSGGGGGDGAGAGLALISRDKANKLDRVYFRSLRPLMAKAKEVEEFVRAAGKAVSSVDVLEQLDYDLNMDVALLEELRLHPRVRVQEADIEALAKDGRGGGGGGGGEKGSTAADSAAADSAAVDEKRFFLLSYNRTFDVRSRAELLQLVERLPSGIALKDLDGSYSRVLEDVKELQASGEVIAMKGCIYREDENGSVTEEFPEIVYPGKHTLPIDVDNDIVELYRSIELPSDPAEFRSEVTRAGIALSTTDSTMHDILARGREQEQQGAAERKRAVKKRRRGIELRTNAHLKNDKRFQMPSQRDG